MGYWDSLMAITILHLNRQRPQGTIRMNPDQANLHTIVCLNSSYVLCVDTQSTSSLMFDHWFAGMLTHDPSGGLLCLVF